MKRVLVANRGEIAVRILRAARARGLETVAVYSEGDRGALHPTMADRALCIGPAAAGASYLRAPAIIAAALGSGCDAIHPGYGFLAENAEFARLCEEHGLIFVGPTAETIARMGDKIAARASAASLGVPTIPGSQGRTHSAQDARGQAERIGFPLLLKAAAGGGGRGMRVVRHPAELAAAFAEAEREATAAFNDGALYVERFLEHVRHVEVQILGDGKEAVVHLGARDCSLQRRSQKLVEEAPALAIPPQRTAEMAEAALRIARALRYRSLGTIEFVYAPQEDCFFFLEMNTRIQVEHPVTEMVTGLDLVGLQLRVAAGETLPITQEQVTFRGHAIECRINAEAPEAGFRPSPGRITEWAPPSGPSVRVDTHCFPGYVVPPYYDSLLAKMIVHALDRPAAIAAMALALADFHVAGIATTIPFQRAIMASHDFQRNAVHTKWIEESALLQPASR